MRLNFDDHSVRLWLTAGETADWAANAGAQWTPSTLSGRALYAEFDGTGLADFAVDGERDDGIDGPEFDAIVSWHLAGPLPSCHPCWPRLAVAADAAPAVGPAPR